MNFELSGWSFFFHWLVSGFAVFLTSRLVSNFEISGYISALIAALVIGLANMFLWPVLIFLTLPINLITLGLFTFVVNGAVLKFCAAILPGFRINTWLAAIFGSIVLSCLIIVLHYHLV